MSKTIFPKEIIKFSQENHYVRFSGYSNIIYLLVISAVILLLAVLPFLKVDITVQSRGTIRSGAEPTSIQTPITGLVKKIHIYENMKVAKGDTLLQLSPEKISDQLLVLNEKITLYSSYVNDLKNLVDNRNINLKSGLLKSNYFQYNQKINEYNLRIKMAEKDFKRIKLLFKKDVIAAADYEKKELEFNQLIKERDFYISQQQSNWHQQLFQYKTELQSLTDSRDQLKFEKRFYVVLAPSNGYISNYTGVQAGSFIFPNQTIASISPSDSLIAECYVSPNDIGYLKRGDEVAIQIDAYNYNHWGLADGEIIDISNQPYQKEGSVYFKVKCKLLQDHLMLKSGYRGELKNGLTFTSRFMVARRSLSDLLFDKADDWLNPKLLTTSNNTP